MSQLKFGGYRFVQASSEATIYRPSPTLTPPRKVDLRPLMTPVEDQGGLQSCTANAIAGAYEYLLKKHTGEHLDLSRLFIYYNARWRNGEQNEDSGSVIQYGMESLQSFGACNEKTWPYNEEAVLDKPRKTSYAEAERFKVLDMQQVEVTLDHWRRCLAEGYPIVFGCALFESFDDCNERGGVVPMPHPNEVSRGEHGLHAMLCVGYSDVDKAFIVRNSWGEDWGDKGYCYMPYNYLMSSKLNAGDCWMLRGENDLPDPDQTWIETDRPLIRGQDSDAINSFADHAYDAIGRLLFETGDSDYSDEVPADYAEFYESLAEVATFVKERYARADEEDETEEEDDAADEEESDEDADEADGEEDGEEEEYDEEGEGDEEEDDESEDDDETEEDEEEEDEEDEDDEDEEDDEESDEEEEEDGDEDEDEGDEGDEEDGEEE